MAEDKSTAIDSMTLMRLTADIVSAHAGNSQLTQAELAETITSVSRALASLRTAGADLVPKELVPAVSVKKSVTPDFIICLEDGKKLKMLKRHLSTAYGMTPAQYREKWSLPRDYPMVAPNYAATRSSLAKKIGLGKSNAKPAGRKRRSAKAA